ncbi:MAG: ABC transporter ATP-binding protein [Myxococcota bacterium]
MSPLIDVTDLSFRRRRWSLEVEAWSLNPGEVVGLVGPYGSGKTTLLHLLQGLFPPDRGAVRVLGVDPWRDPVAARSQVGFASEDLHHFPLPVPALIGLVADYYPGRWDAALAEELREQLQIEDSWKIGALSRGEKVRVGLLLAMAFAPTVLLLDEPLSGIDLGHKRRVVDLILGVTATGTRSVVISSHNLRDIERIADRLIVLKDGRVHASGPTAELVGDERTLEEAMVAWDVAG